MLPRQHRLTKKEFSPALFSGRRFTEGPVVLYVQGAPRRSGMPSRLAFVMGQKAVKGAVARNRLRRRARALARAHLLEISDGWHIVFLFRKESAELSRDELERHLVLLLRRAGLVPS